MDYGRNVVKVVKINKCKISKHSSPFGFDYYLLKDSNNPAEPSLTNSIEETIKFFRVVDKYSDLLQYPIVAKGTDDVHCLVALDRAIPFIPIRDFTDANLAFTLNEYIYEKFQQYLISNKKEGKIYLKLFKANDFENIEQKFKNDDLFCEYMKINAPLIHVVMKRIYQQIHIASNYLE